MKAIKRKLLSLVLAMAMILTLMPTALADEDPVITGSLMVKPFDSSISAGSSQNFSAEICDNATTGGYSITGTTYSWSITSTTAGAVVPDTSGITGSSTGNITFSTAGTYTITATVGGYGPAVNTVPGNVQLTGYTTLTVTEAPAVTPKTITLSGTGVSNNAVSLEVGGKKATVTVTVTGSDNNPMKGQTVTVTNANGGTSATASTSVTTGNDGTANIEVTSDTTQTGTTTFNVSTGTGDDAKSVTLTVNVDESTAATTISFDPTSLTLYPNSSVGSVTVTVMQGNKAVTDTTVSLGQMTVTSGSSSLGSIVTSATVRTPGNPITNTSEANTDANGRVMIDVTPGSATGTVTIPVTCGSVTKKLTVYVSSGTVSLVPQSGTPSIGSTVSLQNWDIHNSGVYYRTFAVSPSISGLNENQINSLYDITYHWYLGDASYVQRYPLTNTSSNQYTLYSNNTYLYYYDGFTNNRLTCIATFKYKGTSTTYTTASAYWDINTGYTGSVLASATVYNSTSSYALGDVDDAGKSSIVSQLDSYFYSTTAGRYGVAYVRFGSVTSGSYGTLSAKTNTDYYTNRYLSGSSYDALSDVLFYPGNTKGAASFPVTVYYYTSSINQSVSYISSITGTITFNVTEGVSTGDITYSASIGSDVSFYQKDFEDFYYSKTRGALSYVSFTLPTTGSLYADGGRLNASNACYVSPTQTQTDLAGVYFSPTGTTATRASTVRISFTASGNRSNVSGTVAITYLAGSAKNITYNVSTSSALKVSDFTDAYRQVVGSAAPTGLTIEFQNVPTYGTLSYTDSSRTNSSVVTLRSTNIKSYKFTTRTTGTNQLGDVTYTANGSHSDTIDYIAYVNNTPQFTGKVVFNGSNTSASNMQVGFTSTNGQAVTFSYAEFSKANPVVIASTSYIRFVTMPTGGTLTYNGAVMTLSSTNVAPASLGSVVYRPNAGFNNSTDRISFLCYDTNGNSVGGGQVSIVVTGNTGSGSNGASSVSQFKDVPANAWYRDDLSRLMSAGIIQGRGDGKFDPTAELTYGEALKIFMLASGYPAQAEASGKDWAINYKNLAVSNGWISSSVDLSAKISRNAMAELAAKSLGVAPTDSVPPVWRDGTSNGYSNALYYTNPQILIGNGDGTFNGTSTLRRQEICAIASRVLNYRSGQQSTDKPGWIG